MALIGAIIGDIIGSRFEFPDQRPETLDWEHCPLFNGYLNEFTDDTVLAIATKYAIDHYKGNFGKAYKEFGRKFPDVGYGDMFFRWLNNKITDYKSTGNGSAMRVAYIGDIVHDIDSVIALSKSSAICTHNTEGGITGACMTASAIAMANSGYSKNDILNICQLTYKGKLYDGTQTMEELRKSYVWSDRCELTVPVAIQCFIESHDYESCMRNCLSLHCDMDTMCCISGGIAEAYYKTTGLNNKKILKTYLPPYLYKCIEDIVEKEEKTDDCK